MRMVTKHVQEKKISASVSRELASVASEKNKLHSAKDSPHVLRIFCMDVVPGTLFLLLSTAVGSLAENDHNCTAQEFEDCLTILKAIAERDDLALPATRQELLLVCRKLQRGVRCIEDHSFRCFTAAQKRIFNSVVSDSRHVIDDLCVPGKLQDDYLRYAPCLKNVSTDEKKCASQYRKLTNNHDMETEDEKVIDVNDGLKMHCCAFTDFVECQHEHLLRDCGHHADQFFQSHLDRMSGSLLNEHCALYTRGSNACLFNQNLAGSLVSRKCDAYRKLFTIFALVIAMLFFIQR